MRSSRRREKIVFLRWMETHPIPAHLHEEPVGKAVVWW